MKILIKIVIFIIPYILLSQNKIDSIEIYSEKNELVKALELSSKLSSFYLKKKDIKSYCKVHIKKATIFRKLSDNEKLLSIGYESLKLAEKNKLDFIKTEIYFVLADGYTALNDTIRAKKFYIKAKNQGEKYYDPKNLSHIYQNLFRLHTKENLDSAFYYLNKKYKLDKKHNNKKAIARNYNNFFAYYASKNEDIAIGRKYLDSAIVYSEKLNVLSTILTSKSNLGYYYMVYENNFKSAIAIYTEMLNKYEGKLTDLDLADIYSNLSYAYYMVKNFKTSCDFTSMHNDLLKKIYNDKLNNSIRSLETKYEIEKIEEENKANEKKLEQKAERSKKIIFIFILLLCFSVILFYFFYQNLQLKQRNKLKEIDNKIQINLINATIEGQNLERKKVSSILHDTISATLSSASLHLMAYQTQNKNQGDEDLLKVKKLIKEAHDKVRDLSHELIPPVLSKLGIVAAIQDLCEKNSNSLMKFKLEFDTFKERRFVEDFELKVYNIISELCNNCIKHSNASVVKITIIENGENLEFEILDDGKGYDMTKTEEKFGLTQIKAHIKSMNGKISIFTKPNKGCRIIFKVQILEL